jgi:small subunit ribosomal protein S19e
MRGNSGSRNNNLFEASPLLKIKSVPHEAFVLVLAERLKHDFNEIRPPAYAHFVKTSSTNFEPPKSFDWWYIRAASILRKLAVKGPMGVKDFTFEYSGKRKRGRRREHFALGASGHVRRILIQLEAAKLVEKQRRGRVLSKGGWDLLLGVAGDVLSDVLKHEPRIKLYVG